MAHAGTIEGGAPDYDYTLIQEGDVPSNVVIHDDMDLFGVDDTSTSFAADGKVATIDVHHISSVNVCKPDSSPWTEMEESRVILNDEELRIGIEIVPQVQTLDQCRLMFGSSISVRTSSSCPIGSSLSLLDSTFLDNSSPGKSVVCVSRTYNQIKDLCILPQGEYDYTEEMACLVMGSADAASASNLTDSEAFLRMGLAFRGNANDSIEHGLEREPPVSPISASYFKAAGVEVICASYRDVKSNARQIMNQADYFYYSGHGHHSTGNLQGDFSPESVQQYWNQDLSAVILAGCSVLDINDYNKNFSGDEHNFSPGKRWERTGPQYLLGNNGSAPGDQGGAPARIVTRWISMRNVYGDAGAWMEANAKNRAWNACAIVKGQKYLYFQRKWMKRKVIDIPKGEW